MLLLFLMDETHRAMTEHDLVPRHGEGSDLHYGKVTLVAVECLAWSKREWARAQLGHYYRKDGNTFGPRIVLGLFSTGCK